MKRLILILCMLTGIAYGQRWQNMPQAGYGPIKQLWIDSNLVIPTAALTGTLISGGRAVAQLRYNETDSSLEVYTGYQWLNQKGAGSTTDTASLSDRINLKVDSVTFSGDSLYYWVNGTGTGLALPGGAGTFSNPNLGDTLLTNPATNEFVIKSSIAGWGVLHNTTDTTITTYIDTTSGKVATQTMLNNYVPALTATRIGYGDGSNLLTGSASLTYAPGTGITTTPKMIANSNTDGGGTNDGAVVITRTVNENNGTHGFRDKTFITGPLTGTASFDAEATISTTTDTLDHAASFQARQIINMGVGSLLNTSWAVIDNTQVHSKVTTLVSLESNPVLVSPALVGVRSALKIKEYSGAINLASNTYGILFQDLLYKSTGDNYGMYDNAANKHFLNNLRIGDKMYVGGNVTPTAKLHIAAGSATVNTAPIKLTTGTVTTAAVAGQIEYTTPQLFFTNGAAVRQELFQGQQSRVSTQYDNTTTTLGNVTGLTANVAAGKIYRFEAKLYTTSNIAGGVKAAIAGTATATAIIYEGLTTDAGLVTQGRGAALGTAVGSVTAVTAAYITITGTITVNAGGTLTVQFAENAATATSSVLVGSTFVVTEIL